MDPLPSKKYLYCKAFSGHCKRKMLKTQYTVTHNSNSYPYMLIEKKKRKRKNE